MYHDKQFMFETVEILLETSNRAIIRYVRDERVRSTSPQSILLPETTVAKTRQQREEYCLLGQLNAQRFNLQFVSSSLLDPSVASPQIRSDQPSRSALPCRTSHDARRTRLCVPATPILLRTQEQTAPRVFSVIMKTENVLFSLVVRTLIANNADQAKLASNT